MAVELIRVLDQAKERWNANIWIVAIDGARSACEIECEGDLVPELCGWLVSEFRYSFGGLIVEQRDRWELRYV
ncbi:MAG: hypothetical protein ACREQR_05145, partial [Candidatus Binataceae bacterium]